MSQSQRSSTRSPLRRARPAPHVPSSYLSPDFSAAEQALRIIEEPGSNVDTTLSSLRSLRDQISSFLQTTAPPWNTLTPAIASLHDTLNTTQSASFLRTSLSTMQANLSARDDYPAQMASVVHRSTQLSANISLASAVRDFAQLLHAAQIPEPFTSPSVPQNHAMSSPGATSSTRSSTNRLSSTDRSPTQNALPDRFLQRAAALHRARAAIDSPPLVHVTALDDARASLTRHHSELQARLETALIDTVYAPVRSSSLNLSAGTDSPHVFAPTVSQKTLSPSPSPVREDALPALYQAVDLLGGSNHAPNIMREAAPSALLALIRDALQSDPAPSPSTMASVPTSSFTTPSPSPNRGHSFPNSPVVQSMSVFEHGLSLSSRLMCSDVFERVRLGMTAVLRRLSALADSVDSEKSTIFDAVHHIWHCMESLLMSFVHVLLAFPSPNKPQPTEDLRFPDELVSTERYPNRISLLPFSPRKSSRSTIEATSVTWELERVNTTPDALTALIQGVSLLTPSIYNLEVAYSPLQQFILMSTRLQHSWRERDGAHLSPTTPPSPSALQKVLVHAVDLFVCTVRTDVRKYMQTVLGKRAGTLLQPISRKDRHVQTSEKNFRHVTGKSDLESVHSLPLLPQTQSIINVIASCVSLGVAVPTIASRIGEIVNLDVIVPFCQRAAQALELAASWSDGGKLFAEMFKKVSRNDNDSVMRAPALSFSDKLSIDNNMKSKRLLFNAIRRERGLATKSLAKLCMREPHRVCNTSVLMENEWNAVVRLVSNAKAVIYELEGCVSKCGENSRKLIYGRGSHPSVSDDNTRLISLCEVLQARGICSNMFGPVVEVIRNTESGCRMLRDEVIERGLILLHCEVVLHSFSRVVLTLSEDVIGTESFGAKDGIAKRRSGFRAGDNSLYRAGDVKGEEGECEDIRESTTVNGLSRPSSIFKALPIQLSDVERTSDEESGGMNEFDEFGDRITIANESVAEPEIEECGFPNSLLLEPGDWKSSEEDNVRGFRHSGLMQQDSVQTVTRSDKRALEGGRSFGEDIKVMDYCVRQNLGLKDGKYVMSEADEGVGYGIRMSGEMRARGDRDVATGARLFLDATATVAAETLGWPGVENDYSVAEGASHGASECRTLLYAAGML